MSKRGLVARDLEAADASGVRLGEAASLGASAALEGVSVAYGRGAPVVEDVSLAIAPGEVVCLVGPSGGGKSTILSLLAGLVAPARGRVVVDGAEVRGPSPERAAM